MSGSVRLGRRGFLALVGSGGALTTLSRVVPAALATGTFAGCDGEADERPADALFSPDEREVLTQVVERMVATGEASAPRVREKGAPRVREKGAPRVREKGAPRVRETGAVSRIEALLRVLDPELVRPLPALLRLVDWGPWLFDATPARFRALEGAAQDASLRGWQQSRFALRRQGFLALRNLAFFGWYSGEASWPGIGYAGPLLGRREGA